MVPLAKGNARGEAELEMDVRKMTSASNMLN